MSARPRYLIDALEAHRREGGTGGGGGAQSHDPSSGRLKRSTMSRRGSSRGGTAASGARASEDDDDDDEEEEEDDELSEEEEDDDYDGMDERHREHARRSQQLLQQLWACLTLLKVSSLKSRWWECEARVPGASACHRAQQLLAVSRACALSTTRLVVLVFSSLAPLLARTHTSRASAETARVVHACGTTGGARDPSSHPNPTPNPAVPKHRRSSRSCAASATRGSR